MLKKICVAPLFLLIFFLFVLPVSAFEFIKSPDNPLPISFISDYSQILQVHVYKENDFYKGIATAKKTGQNYYSLIAIESFDGKTWNQDHEILSIPDNDFSNARLFIDRQGNKKILFARMDSFDLYRIYSFDCDNNLYCNQTPTLVLDPNLNDANENHGFFAPYIFDSGENYFIFYGAWGFNGFRLKLSYSSDLVTWEKCSNEIMTGGDGAFPYVEDNFLYLFVHRSNASGIQVLKTELPLNCNSIWANLGYVVQKTASYDQKHIIFPSIVKNDTNLSLYYSGLGSDSVWRLNLAETVVIPSPTLIPTPTPTPTLILTPLPSETPPISLTLTPTTTPTPIIPETKNPIILIPGFMASWNKEAIFHNKEVGYEDWALASYVKEYRGLINSLKNLGYEEDKDLFVFAYDWRKKIDETTDNLDLFIDSKIGIDQKVDIIGHSLGGVVGRIYSQKYKNDDRVNKLITAGSPHYGVVQVYKPIEAGEIDRDNTWLWLMEKVIINLNRTLFETDREVVQNMLPVTRDLFPTFNFLKNSKGEFINTKTLKISNILLDFYNESFSSIFPLFTALAGEKDSLSTIAGYSVSEQNSLDKLFSNYQDGRPIDYFKDNGDYTVLTNSARNTEDDFNTLPLDHGEIIYKKEGIKKIFDILGISYEDSQIIEGERTIISPSLIFMIKSPAEMEVKFGDNTYNEKNGIIFIENAQSGNYELLVKGLENGDYSVTVAQISENNDVWEMIEGTINQTPATSQIDSYLISYNNETAYSIHPTLTPRATITPTLTITPTPTTTPTQTQSPTSTSIPNPTPTVALQSTVEPTTTVIQSIYSQPTPTVTIKMDNKTEVLGKEAQQTKSGKNLFPFFIFLSPMLVTFIIGIVKHLLKK